MTSNSLIRHPNTLDIESLYLVLTILLDNDVELSRQALDCGFKPSFDDSNQDYISYHFDPPACKSQVERKMPTVGVSVCPKADADDKLTCSIRAPYVLHKW